MNSALGFATPSFVCSQEFIGGILRCKGPARAIDQVAMMAASWLPEGFLVNANRWRFLGDFSYSRDKLINLIS